MAKPSTSMRTVNNSNYIPGTGKSFLIKMTEKQFPMLKVTLMVYNNGSGYFEGTHFCRQQQLRLSAIIGYAETR